MSPVRTVQTGAVLAALAVALGAFGAHGLRDLVTADRLATFETAVRYLMYHSLGLILIGALRIRNPWPARTLLAGSLIFSGSLFLLVMTGAGWWGAVAPVGGALQVGGWLLLALLAGRPSASTGAG
jgi:uncharacterized membrane protein YgdD (TMEM256/DUF423 family)